MTQHVLRPNWFGNHVLNPTVRWFTHRGISPHGAQTLTVRGRSSGEWRSAPVNPMEVDGRTYLVAPRGHVQWTHNMRAAGAGRLRLGKRVRAFTAAEVPDEEKTELLRTYLRRWKFDVGGYFRQAGITVDATDQEWEAVAGHFPVFRLTWTD